MKKNEYIIRKATIYDIPEIQEITKSVFKVYAENTGIKGNLSALDETYEDVKKDLETKNVYVALLNNELIGSVRIEIKPDNTAYLSRFGIKTEYQNKGIGKILMQEIDKSMISLGITNLYLHTASRMLSLVRFYYGLGFYIESTTKDRGYIRALLCKCYEEEVEFNPCDDREII